MATLWTSRDSGCWSGCVVPCPGTEEVFRTGPCAYCYWEAPVVEGGQDLPRLRVKTGGQHGQECQVLGCPLSLSAVLVSLTSTAGEPTREMGLNCEHFTGMQTQSTRRAGQ